METRAAAAVDRADRLLPAPVPLVLALADADEEEDMVVTGVSYGQNEVLLFTKTCKT